MHPLRKASLGLGLALFAFDEITKKLYEQVYEGAIFLGTGVKIRHKFLNYLNNQNTKFIVVGDGYNKWNCSDLSQIGSGNLFLYSNTKLDSSGNPQSSLCGLHDSDVRFQLNSIIKSTVYNIPYLNIEKKPDVVEIFGSRSEVLLDEFSGLAPDTLLISHSGREHSSMSSISDSVALEMMSTFVNDAYHRFILSVLLNPDKTILSDGVSKFVVEPVKHNLCSDESIIEFQDETASKFKDFYNSLNYTGLSPKMSVMSEFFEDEKLPIWYKELQSEHLENFKTLLLMHNIFLGNLDNAGCLVDKGTSITSALYNGVSPLLVSVTTGNKEAVKFCLEKGADINQSRDNGITPMMAAYHFKYDDIFNFLVERDADLMLNKPQNLLSIAYAARDIATISQIISMAVHSKYLEEVRSFVGYNIGDECFKKGKTIFADIYNSIIEDVSDGISRSYQFGEFSAWSGISQSEQQCLLGGFVEQQT